MSARVFALTSLRSLFSGPCSVSSLIISRHHVVFLAFRFSPLPGDFMTLSVSNRSWPVFLQITMLSMFLFPLFRSESFKACSGEVHSRKCSNYLLSSPPHCPADAARVRLETTTREPPRVIKGRIKGGGKRDALGVLWWGSASDCLSYKNK